MYGFAGFLATGAGALGSPEAVVTRMALAIQHREPDDAGVRVRNITLRSKSLRN